MKLLCKYLGGSHAYGLNTPESDEDIRFVFAHTDATSILGLDSRDFVDKRSDTEDSFGSEIRHFLAGLRKSNTQSLETLYLPENQFEVLDSKFKELILDNKEKLVDPDKLYLCLREYTASERKLACGERAGKLGGKRREALDKYGYSPKNFVQLFRLAHCGITFFNEGFFPVNFSEHDLMLNKSLLDLKVNPQNYTKEELVQRSLDCEDLLDKAYAENKAKAAAAFRFDEVYANKCLLEFYYHSLKKEREAQNEQADNH